MKVIGIDIGSFSIKVAEVEGVGKNFQLRRVLELPLSADPSKDQKIEIIDHLRNLSLEYQDQGVKFILGLDQENVAIRSKVFPFRERFKILKSLAFELEDDIPFPGEESVFDFRVLHYQANAAQILALAAPKDRVRERLDLAHDCGVEPQYLSLEGLALANVFENWQEPPPEWPADYQPTPDLAEGKLIIDIGHKKTLILAVVKGVVSAIRTIDFGALDIARTIATRYNLHIVEALKELQKKGFLLLSTEGASLDQVTYSDTLKRSLDPLTQELRLILVELQAELQANFETATLVGGASPIRNLGAYLTQKIELATNRLTDLHGLAGLQINAEVKHPHSALIAIGLAIEGFRRPRNPAVNFIRGEFVKQGSFLSQFWDKWGHALQVGTAAFIFLIVYGWFKEDFAIRLTERTQEVLKQQALTVADLKGLQASSRNIRKFIKDQENIDKMRTTAEKVYDVNSALDLLKQISQVAPDRQRVKMDVVRFKVEGHQVEIAGRVNAGGLKEVIASLSRASKLKAETFRPEIKDLPGTESFGIKLQMNRIQGR